ncbi:hypothetical protein HDU87_007157 [Geranomyces variabilis]|uniref:Uncharacterized protein n=1 Tax=Geranomyces variabilis TaxID=109894 RepID=A0AAD5XQ12_9FUNG|nr:hypothetical protein HDU87_007157 [Geranomyces variabilis]
MTITDSGEGGGRSRLLVHGDGSHVKASSYSYLTKLYLGTDLTRYDAGAMWNGHGTVTEPANYLASRRLVIPVIPHLSTVGLDSISAKDPVYKYLLELIKETDPSPSDEELRTLRKDLGTSPRLKA